MKYAQRYGKKDGYNRADLFKVIHYGFLALYNHDTHVKENGRVMKISNDTRNILKNFSTINSGIRVKTGNKVETISNMKNILAVATVDESFPQDFSIYNLPEFLGATSLLDDPEFTFGDASLTVADDNSSLAYFYASEGMVVAPDKMITMPERDQYSNQFNTTF